MVDKRFDAPSPAEAAVARHAAAQVNSIRGTLDNLNAALHSSALVELRRNLAESQTETLQLITAELATASRMDMNFTPLAKQAVQAVSSTFGADRAIFADLIRWQNPLLDLIASKVSSLELINLVASAPIDIGSYWADQMSSIFVPNLVIPLEDEIAEATPEISQERREQVARALLYILVGVSLLLFLAFGARTMTREEIMQQVMPQIATVGIALMLYDNERRSQ